MTCVRRLAGARSPAPSTLAGSSRQPDRDPRRWRARLTVPALLLAALPLLAAAPSLAQDILVTNFDQTAAPVRSLTGSIATGFTTGAHGPGYGLSSIEAKISNPGTPRRAACVPSGRNCGPARRAVY